MYAYIYIYIYIYTCFTSCWHARPWTLNPKPDTLNRGMTCFPAGAPAAAERAVAGKNGAPNCALKTRA